MFVLFRNFLCFFMWEDGSLFVVLGVFSRGGESEGGKGAEYVGELFGGCLFIFFCL